MPGLRSRAAEKTPPPASRPLPATPAAGPRRQREYRGRQEGGERRIEVCWLVSFESILTRFSVGDGVHRRGPCNRVRPCFVHGVPAHVWHTRTSSTLVR